MQWRCHLLFQIQQPMVDSFGQPDLRTHSKKHHNNLLVSKLFKHRSHSRACTDKILTFLLLYSPLFHGGNFSKEISDYTELVGIKKLLQLVFQMPQQFVTIVSHKIKQSGLTLAVFCEGYQDCCTYSSHNRLSVFTHTLLFYYRCHMTHRASRDLS